LKFDIGNVPGVREGGTGVKSKLYRRAKSGTISRRVVGEMGGRVSKRGKKE